MQPRGIDFRSQSRDWPKVGNHLVQRLIGRSQHVPEVSLRVSWFRVKPDCFAVFSQGPLWMIRLRQGFAALEECPGGQRISPEGLLEIGLGLVSLTLIEIL